MAKKLFEQIKNFFTQAKTELGLLRDKIGAVSEEIYELEHRPIDLESAKLKLQEGIAAIGNRFAEDRFRQLFLSNEQSPPDALAVNFQGVDPFHFACWATPEAVQAKMEAVLEERLAVTPGIDPVSRAEKLTELRVKLHALETEEESLVREASTVGMRIGRRRDASPEIVLGP